jgi:hypothetical protein
VPVAAAIVGAVVAASAALWFTRDDTPATKPTFDLSGTLSLAKASTYGMRDDGYRKCEGTGGYSDISEGTSVTVYDAAGTVLALGKLEGSKFRNGDCEFTFTVTAVPAGEQFYQVEVAHRGKVSFPSDKARSGVGLTLGSD